jgi:hypothetical protein
MHSCDRSSKSRRKGKNVVSKERKIRGRHNIRGYSDRREEKEKKGWEKRVNIIYSKTSGHRHRKHRLLQITSIDQKSFIHHNPKQH